MIYPNAKDNPVIRANSNVFFTPITQINSVIEIIREKQVFIIWIC